MNRITAIVLLVGSWAFSNPEKTEDGIQTGIRLLDQKQDSLALESFLSEYAKGFRGDTLHYYIARCYQNLHQYQQALGANYGISRLWPEAHYQRIEILHQLGLTSKALRALRLLEKSHPGSPWVRKGKRRLGIRQSPKWYIPARYSASLKNDYQHRTGSAAQEAGLAYGSYSSPDSVIAGLNHFLNGGVLWNLVRKGNFTLGAGPRFKATKYARSFSNELLEGGVDVTLTQKRKSLGEQAFTGSFTYSQWSGTPVLTGGAQWSHFSLWSSSRFWLNSLGISRQFSRDSLRQGTLVNATSSLYPVLKWGRFSLNGFTSFLFLDFSGVGTLSRPQVIYADSLETGNPGDVQFFTDGDYSTRVQTDGFTGNYEALRYAHDDESAPLLGNHISNQALAGHLGFKPVIKLGRNVSLSVNVAGGGMYYTQDYLWDNSGSSSVPDTIFYNRGDNGIYLAEDLATGSFYTLNKREKKRWDYSLSFRPGLEWNSRKAGTFKILAHFGDQVSSLDSVHPDPFGYREYKILTEWQWRYSP